MSMHRDWIRLNMADAFMAGANAAYRHQHGRSMAEAERREFMEAIEAPHAKWLDNVVSVCERNALRVEAAIEKAGA
jgi:hypothetical protein